MIGVTIHCSAQAYTVANITNDEINEYSGRIWVEGYPVRIDFPVLSYNSTVYIPATTAEKWSGKTLSLKQNGKYIEFNRNSNTKNSAMSIQQIGDVQILCDNTHTFSSPVIICDEVTYIPIRLTFEQMGWQVIWRDHGEGTQIIYLQSAISADELEQVQLYLDDGYKLLAKLRRTASLFWLETDKNDALTLLYQARQDYQWFLNNPMPTSRFAAQEVDTLNDRVRSSYDDLLTSISNIEGSSTLREIQNDCPALYDNLSGIESSLWKIKRGLYQI